MNEKKRAEFAAILRSHVSVLAATKVELSLGIWNDIANDILEAADMIQGQQTALPDIPTLKPITAQVRELNPDAWR